MKFKQLKFLFTRKMKPKVSPKPLARLATVQLTHPVEADCGVCGEDLICHFYDHDLRSPICAPCRGALRDAEIQLRAFIVNKDPYGEEAAE